MERIEIVGNVGKEPQMEYQGDGTCRVNFSVAVNTRRKKNNQVIEETHWWYVTAFGSEAEVLGEHLNPGDKVFLAGRLDLDATIYKGEPQVRRRLIVGAKNYMFLSPRQPSNEQAEKNPPPAGNTLPATTRPPHH